MPAEVATEAPPMAISRAPTGMRSSGAAFVPVRFCPPPSASALKTSIIAMKHTRACVFRSFMIFSFRFILRFIVSAPSIVIEYLFFLDDNQFQGLRYSKCGHLDIRDIDPAGDRQTILVVQVPCGKLCGRILVRRGRVDVPDHRAVEAHDPDPPRAGRQVVECHKPCEATRLSLVESVIRIRKDVDLREIVLRCLVS